MKRENDERNRRLARLSNIEKFVTTNPAIYFDNNELLNLLLENKIIPTSFPYPTASGKLSRIVVSAHHTEEDLDAMVKQLNIFSNLSTNLDSDIRFVL